MSHRFDDLTQADAFQLVEPPDGFAEAKAFVLDGDHWQDGDGFTGPTVTSTNPEYSTLQKALKAKFTYVNLLREVVDRRVKGVVGKRPHLSVQLQDQEETGELSEQEEARIQEVQDALDQWFQRERYGPHEALKKVARSVSCFKDETSGVGYLRIWIPRGRLSTEDVVEGGEVVGETPPFLDVSAPEEALEHIFVEALYPDQATHHVERASMETVGVVAMQEEVGTGARSTTQRVAELTYLSTDTTEEGQRLSVIRSITDSDETYSATLDLRGQLMLYEVRHEAIVTADVRSQQKAYNTRDTERGIVLDQEGFPEVILTNTMGPGEWTTDENGNAVFEPEPFERGPGQRSAIMGEPILDPETGEVTGYTSPSVEQLTPADIESYRVSMEDARQAILDAAGQRWVEMSDDATASGESRLQSFFDYLEDLEYFKAELDKAGRWMVETVWSLACDLAGVPGRDHDLDMYLSCNISMPHVPAPVRQALLQEVEQGLRSRESAMAALGITDVQAEMQRIAEGEEYQLELLRRRADVIQGLTAGGARLEQAAVAAGMEEEDAQRLARMDEAVVGVESTRANGQD